MADEMGNANDFDAMQTAETELAPVFNEQVTVKRFVGYGTAPISGQQATPKYLTFNTTATIDDIGIEKASNNDGVYSAGDLECQIRVKLNASTGGVPGDRIIYQGVEYYIVQKPLTINLNGILHYECILRRAKS